MKQIVYMNNLRISLCLLTRLENPTVGADTRGVQQYRIDKSDSIANRNQIEYFVWFMFFFLFCQNFYLYQSDFFHNFQNNNTQSNIM